MKIPLSHIPDEIITEYSLNNKVHRDGAIYIEIRKGMYGLPQAGMLANKLLKRRLAKHGYYEVRHMPGYWRHVWRPIVFTLVVDDFGVGYDGNEHAVHLLQTLRLYYEAVSVDWTGTLYCGITLKWDYLCWKPSSLLSNVHFRNTTKIAVQVLLLLTLFTFTFEPFLKL